MSAEGNDSDTEQFVDSLVNTAHKIWRHFGYVSIISFTRPKSDDISLMLHCLWCWLWELREHLAWRMVGSASTDDPRVIRLLSLLLLFMGVQHAFSLCHLDRIQFVSNKKITHFSFHWKMCTGTLFSLQQWYAVSNSITHKNSEV